MSLSAGLRRRTAPLLVVVGAAAFGAGALGVASLDVDLASAARPVRAAPAPHGCPDERPVHPEDGL
jgi:hypothetical protein